MSSIRGAVYDPRGGFTGDDNVAGSGAVVFGEDEPECGVAINND